MLCHTAQTTIHLRMHICKTMALTFIAVAEAPRLADQQIARNSTTASETATSRDEGLKR